MKLLSGERIRLPRFVIGAPASGSGKSTLAAGLMAAFSERVVVQGFKVGPDYIDPMYHSLACGRPARNLDSWMTSPEYVRQSFPRASQGAGLAVIEGVMGLFDGYGGDTEAGSTAEVAKLLDAPVILVLDASRMARSAAAIALGCRDYDPDVRLAGVICNRVGSPEHARMLREAIERIGIPVLGCLPGLDALHVPERHLGLFTAVERQAETKRFLEAAAAVVKEHLDLDTIWRIASSARALDGEITQIPPDIDPVARISVAYDEAFCFYYQDNLDLLRQSGAELVFFSPLHESDLPDGLDGLYLGGGYPELYAQEIAQNEAFLDGLRRAHKKALPIYAECGGLMTLSESISDLQGQKYNMAGLLPGRTVCQTRLQMGYRHVRAARENVLMGQGQVLRGHEFHYSDWEGNGEARYAAYEVSGRTLQGSRPEGFSQGNLSASYVHLHFGTEPKLAARFVESCRLWRASQRSMA